MQEPGRAAQMPGEQLTRDEHIERHKFLHAALDEIIADFLTHECAYPSARGPSHITVMELLEWSHLQTLEPAGRADDDAPRETGEQ